MRWAEAQTWQRQAAEGESGEPWRVHPAEEVGRGACLDNSILERKSLMTVGPGQNFCEGLVPCSVE